LKEEMHTMFLKRSSKQLPVLCAMQFHLMEELQVSRQLKVLFEN